MARNFAHKKRPKSARRLRDEQLMPLIEQVHAESGGTYGARQITRTLPRKGVDVAHCAAHLCSRGEDLDGAIQCARQRCGWAVHLPCCGFITLSQRSRSRSATGRTTARASTMPTRHAERKWFSPCGLCRTAEAGGRNERMQAGAYWGQ
ncbi:IS3 family transposase [Streptomyces sioyaensis]|uniref:IS3 family transposase n=1 Tax=Streptomyces sioyaensis TaxID=67364 RepID=UPI0037954326